ncbi:B3 domain-containing protein Os01g0905400-like isoform X2 [Typha latifolia]|uniref:B3 domain-containing protein Os01g0905400-like isoform X2 n=1 Tax=Typha latifolia TaxID=4733 RepID=UPI003C2C47BF
MSSPKKKKKESKECTKKCLGTRGKSSSALPPYSSSVSAAPSFFKIMIGDFSEALYIPPMFARTIGDLVDKIIFLEDSYGHRWRVKTCLVDGSLAFGYGWHNFVLDHSIRTGEFVVFKHITKLIFSVQIFAASACERLHLCEKNERNHNRKRRKKVKTSTELSSGKIQKSLDTTEEKLCIAVKIPPKAEKVISMTDHDISSTKMAVGNCCDGGAGDDLDQSNRPPCPTNSSEKLETASMIRFSEDFPHIVDEDAIDLEISGEIPAGNIDVDMDRMVMTQKDLEKEVKCERSSQDAEFLENDKMSHSHRDNLREPQTALAKECKETKSNKQSQSSLAVVTYPCTNGCLTMDYSKGDTLETSVKRDKKERIASSRPQTLDVNSPENKNLASSKISTHKFQMKEIKICEQAKQDTDKLNIRNNAISFNANAKDATISPGYKVAIIKKNYSPYGNQVEALSSACAFKCSNDEKETLMSSCNNTQFGIKNENQASGNAPLVSFHKEQGRSVSSGESDPKIISNMSVLHEHSDIMEQKIRDSGISFAVVKTERMDPIDIQLPNHGKSSFALAVTAQSWLYLQEFHERLPFRLGKIKHGRKVITLRDPCMRIWPVLYHESDRFVGFISGWEEFTKANNLRKGHTCEFELYSTSGPTFQVHISKQ